MNTQPLGNVLASKVIPFRAIADDADMIIVNPASFGPPPSFQVIVGRLTPAVPEVPGIPAIPQRSGPNRPDFRPAVPAVPPVPAVPASFTPHRQDTIIFTQEEWDKWDASVPDNDYILSVIEKRLSITLTDKP